MTDTMRPGNPNDTPIDTPIRNLKIVPHSELGREVALREVAKWWEDISEQFAANGDETASADAAKHAEHYRTLLHDEGAQ